MAATTTVGGVAMAGKATIAVAVALGCASGFVGGRLSSTVSGSDVGNQVEMLQARVADLETEPARAPILRGRSGPASEAPLPVQPGMSEPLEAALLALLESPSPALRARFREALEDPVSERDEPTVRLSDEEERKLAEFIADIDAVLDGWSETYGLREFQVEELKVVARRSIARMVEAKRQGASPQELAAMDVAAQAEVRRIVGDAVYLATERERVTGEARKALTWLSAAVGLTPTQHTQLDRLVAEGVERDLPAIVRLRSESLIDDDREALQRSLEQQREENWLRIRNELLTEEQRQRIPGK
jgi:hypothetical protein